MPETKIRSFSFLKQCSYYLGHEWLFRIWLGLIRWKIMTRYSWMILALSIWKWMDKFISKTKTRRPLYAHQLPLFHASSNQVNALQFPLFYVSSNQVNEFHIHSQNSFIKIHSSKFIHQNSCITFITHLHSHFSPFIVSQRLTYRLVLCVKR